MKQRWPRLEMALVIGLPLAAVIAGLLTLFIAHRHGYTPLPAQVDRFALEQAPADD